MQNLSISCALVCLIILGSAALIGAFGVCQRQISAILVTGVMYLLAGTRDSELHAIARESLMIVFTRFSSLCTLHSDDYSFQEAEGKADVGQWLRRDSWRPRGSTRVSADGAELAWRENLLHVLEPWLGLGRRSFVCTCFVLLDIFIETHEVHATVTTFDVNIIDKEVLNTVVVHSLCCSFMQCFHCSDFTIVLYALLLADRNKKKWKITQQKSP